MGECRISIEQIPVKMNTFLDKNHTVFLGGFNKSFVPAQNASPDVGQN